MFYVILALAGTVPDGYTIAKTQHGLASVYWPGDGHSGKVCADGRPFTRERCHIAHRSWPLGRKVRVCSRKTGRCTVSFVGDRGPFGACDHKGIRRNFTCRGKWLVKIRRRDPGTWRGIADLSKCVWKKIGGPGMQIIRLDLLTPQPAGRRLAEDNSTSRWHLSNTPVPQDSILPAVPSRRNKDTRRLRTRRSQHTALVCR